MKSSYKIKLVLVTEVFLWYVLRMNVVLIVFQLLGSLGLLLYGMNMLSDGIQKSAGKTLSSILGFMTSNRFMAVFTGLFITMIVQSSSATTVMVVSFVNAGLLTLTQAVGVIFGANIGTTVTAWIVALIGFKFKIALFAIPIFGVGYIIAHYKRIRKENIGEALMGFGLLFLGLDLLSGAIPSFGADSVGFLSDLQNSGVFSLFIGVVAGLAITVLLHSSSASTAVILTMAAGGLLEWEFAATMILGSNIGTTIDAVLASIGTKVNARRAALVHVLFNITGTVIAIIFLFPLLNFVDFVTPGTIEDSMPSHIAMLHTIFNAMNTLLFLPFTTQIAKLTKKIIKNKENDVPEQYVFPFISMSEKESVEPHLLQVKTEMAEMLVIANDMFARAKQGFSDRTEAFVVKHFDFITGREDYIDQMQEELSMYLVKCSALPITEHQRNTISGMIKIIDEIETLTDQCYSLSLQLKRSIEKKMTFEKDDTDKIIPYVDLVQQLLDFASAHLGSPLQRDELQEAQNLEDQIDMIRTRLKKTARKRLEEGAHVKTELLYIDMVRTIEKIGDHAFGITETLFEYEQ